MFMLWSGIMFVLLGISFLWIGVPLATDGVVLVGVPLAIGGLLIAGVAAIKLVIPYFAGWRSVQMQCPRCGRPSARELVWKGSTGSEVISIFGCRYCGYRWDERKEIEPYDSPYW